MKKYFLFSGLVICLLITLAATAQAADPYFGFKLGRQNFADIRKDLKERGATYTDSLNYKGYDELRSIRVLKHSLFDLEGDLSYALLEFDSDQILYRVSIVWRDQGPLFKRWKETLDNTPYFNAEQCRTEIFDQHCSWRNNAVTFRLDFDAAGLGRNSNITLSFVNQLAVPNVEAAKQRIDSEVERERVIQESRRFHTQH